MARVQGAQKLEWRFKAIPDAVQAAVMEADRINADEFMTLVASIVPKGDDAGKGNEKLVDTLEHGPSKHGFGTQVSIGGKGAPYPAHLEFGHMAKGGVHVPGKPFWYTALRIKKKKFRRRSSWAARTALKSIASGGS